MIIVHAEICIFVAYEGFELIANIVSEQEGPDWACEKFLIAVMDTPTR